MLNSFSFRNKISEPQIKKRAVLWHINSIENILMESYTHHTTLPAFQFKNKFRFVYTNYGLKKNRITYKYNSVIHKYKKSHKDFPIN